VDEDDGWCEAVQYDEEDVVTAVRQVLDNYADKVHLLVNATDRKGRRCLDIAGPTCKSLMQKKIYLFEKYEIKEGPPEHRSATSVVVHATEYVDFVWVDECNCTNTMTHTHAVALKFMKFPDQFQREVDTRSRGDFDTRYVIPITCSYDGEKQDVVNKRFRADAKLKGFELYPYCVVMEAASQSLKRLIDQQHIVGTDWDEIRRIGRQVAGCLKHLHERGYVHGDIKRKNIVIDLIHVGVGDAAEKMLYSTLVCFHQLLRSRPIIGSEKSNRYHSLEALSKT